MAYILLPMKSARNYILLAMMFALEDKGMFVEKDIMYATGCSRSSFFRALSDLRCYLQEQRPWEELDYDNDRKAYFRHRAI